MQSKIRRVSPRQASLSLTAIVLALALALLIALLCAGCANGGASTDGSQQASSEGSGAVQVVRIGTMPTEDILPIWVAEQEGLFADLGFEVKVESFDSAPALSAAITAGEVDLAMTDIMRAVKLTESGAPVTLEWVTLGTEPDQGRFGILAAADAPFDTLPEMAAYAADHPDGDVFVGAAANTVPEYVFDKLVEEEAISPDALKTAEVASLPERFSLVASGNLAAAALPNSLLTLGEVQGMKVIADDTQGANISQSVMVAREAFARDHEQEILKIASAWDQAVALIAADPAFALEVLSEHASLNSQVKDAYVIATYPLALVELDKLAHPDATFVTPQLAWMAEKGYGAEGVTYDPESGALIS